MFDLGPSGGEIGQKWKFVMQGMRLLLREKIGPPLESGEKVFDTYLLWPEPRIGAWHR